MNLGPPRYCAKFAKAITWTTLLPRIAVVEGFLIRIYLYSDSFTEEHHIIVL